ncbi:MAG: sodium:proton antiporter [Micrococcales bacterium]|nr:MAG: sodium:proton antiporter [Micrococcales bacterium]PIE27099.1 MAG: sodium:proton antiporter [Micrococcales bacterium]
MDPAVYLALAVGLAVTLQVLAALLKVPSLLLLLVAGFGLGQVVTPDEVLGRDMLFAGVTLAVGLILFEGALTLQRRTVRDLGTPISRLCTVTVAVSWLLTTLVGVALGLDLRVAALLGAILVVTGPTVINPILRTLRPTRRVSQLLRWESIIVDPIGAILAVGVYQVVTTIGDRQGIGTGLLTLTLSIAVAAAFSLPVGWALTHILRRHLIPDYLHGVVMLSVTVAALVASNLLVEESGLLTVTVLGVYLANQEGLHLEPVTEFMEHLQILFVGALFIMLAGRVTPGQVLDVAPLAGWFVLALVLVIRPVSIQLSLWRTKTAKSERTLMTFMAPRGIVAAAVTSIFAEEFHHAAEQTIDRAAELRAEDPQAAERVERFAVTLANLADEADTMVPLVFIVIVATVAIYGLGVGRLAERLSLATTAPRGVMFSSAPPWVVATAEVLRDLDVPTLVVARRGFDLARARNAGLRTEAADVLSEYAVEEMDLSGIKTFVATSPDDDTNTIACSSYARDLGRANTFQVSRRDHHDGDDRTGRAGQLVTRAAFDPALTYEELESKWRTERDVATVALTEEYSYEDFREQHPDDVVLFVHRANETGVAHAEMAEAAAGDVLVVMR